MDSISTQNFFVHICQCTVVVFHPALNHLHHNPTEPWAVSRPGWRSWPRPCSGLRMWMCWWWTGCMAPLLPTTWWWRITRRWLCRSLSSSTSCRWDKDRVIFWNSSMLLLLLLKEEHSWLHLRSISLSIKHVYSSACNRLRAAKDAQRWFQLRINVSNRNMDANWSPSTSLGSVWGHMSLVSLGLYLEGRLEESLVRRECIILFFLATDTFSEGKDLTYPLLTSLIPLAMGKWKGWQLLLCLQENVQLNNKKARQWRTSPLGSLV